MGPLWGGDAQGVTMLPATRAHPPTAPWLGAESVGCDRRELLCHGVKPVCRLGQL